MNDDCLINVLSFLDINSIKNCFLINKHFNILAKNDLIWKILLIYQWLIKHIYIIIKICFIV